MAHKSERTRSLEDTLSRLLQDLACDVSEDGIADALRKANSLGRIKTTEEYKRDRELALEKLTRVPQLRKLVIQSEEMLKEVEASSHFEYTPSKLPLLLHQFFTDRVSQLVQLKHNLQVRWARFALHDSKTITDLNSSYEQTMHRIMHQYNDSLNRSRRLSRACDLHLAGKPAPPGLVAQEDIIIYLRWLVHHLHTTRVGVAFMSSIQLLPFLIQETPVTPSRSPQRLGARSMKNWGRASKGILSCMRLFSFVQSTPSALGTEQKEPVISSSLPNCSTQLSEFQEQLQQLMKTYNIVGSADGESASDQLQLYYNASRQFTYIFQQQERMATLHAYDAPIKESTNTRKQRSQITYIKPANWTQHAAFKLEPNLVHGKALVGMKEAVSEIHPLILLSNQCTQLTNHDKVLFALRQHYELIRHYSAATPTSVPSHNARESVLLWKCIYSAVDMRNPMDLSESHTKFSLEEHSSEGAHDRGSVRLSSALQLLQEDTGRSISAQANSTPQDSFFSFLLLRHLRIRDLRSKCLSILNYFTSIERTLTINSVGLSEDLDPAQCTRGMGRHLFKSPVDFQLNEADFMSYFEVENHDDYYVHTEESSNGGGCAVQVWDQEGKVIMYDIARSRLTALEEELLTVGSYYIQTESLRKNTNDKDTSTGDSSSSPKLTDMFAILLDLWNCEVTFQEQKMKVINHYLDAYHSIYDKVEKTRIAQVILSLSSLRPRFDLTSPYFTNCYKQEVSCLKQQAATVSSFLDDLVAVERSYNKSVCVSDEDRSKGLPISVPHTHPISLSGDLGTGVSLYQLECLSSPSLVSLLPHVVQHALDESMDISTTKDNDTLLTTHTRLWRKAREKWESYQFGVDYNNETYQNLFSSPHTEDPHAIVDSLALYCKQYLLRHHPTTPTEQQTTRLQASCHLLQLLTSRHTLLIAAQKTAVLHSLYRDQLARLEEEKSHAFLRCQPLTSSSHLPSDRQLEEFVRLARDSKNTTQLDRYSIEYVPLAVHELEDRELGRFSFRSREDMMKILTSRNGLQNVITTLQTQIAAQNALLIGCQQNALIINNTAGLEEDKKFSTFADLVRSASQHSEKLQLITVIKSSFVSLQKEKGAIRDHMTAKFSSLSTQSRTREEVEKIKCSLISEFCANLISSMACYSLRQQITLVYQKMDSLLQNYPSTREAYFTIGALCIPAVLESTKQSYGRPRAIFSADGRSLLNLFYIPHVSEVVTMYNTLPVQETTDTLTHILRLSSILYDIIMFHSASSKLANMCLNSSVQYAGIEDIGHDVHQLQSQINQLDNPTDPQDVFQFLILQRDCLLHSQAVVVNHYLHHTLLMNGTHDLLKTLDDVCIPSLSGLYYNVDQPRPLAHPLMPVPHTHSGECDNLFPWRQFVQRNGVCLVSGAQFVDVYSHVFLSIASLNPRGRQIASGELMGLSLLLEDVLFTSNFIARSLSPRFNPSPSLFSQHPSSSIAPRISRSRRLSQISLSSAWGPISASRISVSSSPLPPLPPIPSTGLIYKFLCVCLQLEQLRVEWGRGLVGVTAQTVTKEARHLDELFQTKVVNVARRIVARQEVKTLLRAHAESDTATESLSTTTVQTDTDITIDDIEQSKSLNEVALREAQLCRLKDMVDQLLLQEEIRLVSSLLKQALQEHQRDTETLPLDLWKKSTMKEIVGIPRPHLVEDFLHSLHSKMAATSGTTGVVELPQDHFMSCVNQLSCAVLERERECYQLYATFYESTLLSLYHQLYLKNQEIEGHQKQIEKLSTESQEENIALVAEHTHSLILEITSLRLEVADLQRQLKQNEEKMRKQILREYQSLMSELQSSSLTVKDQYEQYRKKLFKETVSGLYDVKQQAFSSIAALREKMSGSTIPPPIAPTDIHYVQDQNIHLASLITKLRSLDHWRRQQMIVSADHKVSELENELEHTRAQLVNLALKSDDERQSLNHQIQALQKNLTQEEKRCMLLLKELESEKQRRTSAYAAGLKDKMSSINRDEQKSQLDSKISEMAEELEEKNRLLQSLEAEQYREKRKAEHNRSRSAKALSLARQQLKQEKLLKHEAFEQLEELLIPVDDEPKHTRRPQTGTQLFTRVHHPTRALHSAAPGVRVTRPKSVGGRLRTATPSEVESLSQEIGALKLI